MKKIIAITFGLVVFTTTNIKAQQLTFNSQYMLNQFLINPAAAGTNNDLNFGASFRQQWAGFEDAPRTQTLVGDGLIGDNMGVGGMIYNDITGPLRNVGLNASYSYHIKINRESKLALGLSLSMSQHVLDASQFILNDEVDATLTGSSYKSFNPDAAFGAYYYGENYFVGASIPQLLQGKYKFEEVLPDSSRHVRHYFLSGGYKFEINNEFEIEPSMLLKATSNAPVQFDINARLIYAKSMWVGASFRNKESLVAMLGMTKKNFLIGYSYDYVISNIRNYSGGTHELYLGFVMNSGNGRSSFSHSNVQ